MCRNDGGAKGVHGRRAARGRPGAPLLLRGARGEGGVAGRRLRRRPPRSCRSTWPSRPPAARSSRAPTSTEVLANHTAVRGIRRGMRHLAGLAGLVVGLLSPFAASGTASAVAETCRGVPATIVGQSGTLVTGTEGPDVIVTNGAWGVEARGGDDLICTTATAGPVASPVGDALLVYSGAGIDTVDRTADVDPRASSLVNAVEIFVGSEAADRVLLDGAPGRVDIMTGGGGDLVSVAGNAQPERWTSGRARTSSSPGRAASHSRLHLWAWPWLVAPDGTAERPYDQTGLWTMDNTQEVLRNLLGCVRVRPVRGVRGDGEGALRRPCRLRRHFSSGDFPRVQRGRQARRAGCRCRPVGAARRSPHGARLQGRTWVRPYQRSCERPAASRRPRLGNGW